MRRPLVFSARDYASQIDKATLNGRDITSECVGIVIYAQGPRPREGMGWAYLAGMPAYMDPVTETVITRKAFGLIGLTWNGIGAEG